MELFEALDQSRFVPLNYPDLVACKQSVGCPQASERCPPVPCYVKEAFCSEWGNHFKCMCPPANSHPSPFRGVRKELNSLDYFTRMPDNPYLRRPYPQMRGGFRYQTAGEKYGLIPFKDCPSQTTKTPYLPVSRETMQMPLCSMEQKVDMCDERVVDDNPYDLPFCVKVGAFPDADSKPKPPRSGVAQCLQPSTSHDLQTVYRDTYKDIFKIKTAEELKYYRSPLAIDTRRKMLTLPSDQDKDIVMSGPITLNALPLILKPSGKQKFPTNMPKFKVIVQGPICI